jgi:hypothetical protein
MALDRPCDVGNCSRIVRPNSDPGETFCQQSKQGKSHRRNSAVAKPLVRRIIRITLGVFLILLGIVGLVTPGIQGILCIFLGLALLARHIPFVDRQFKRVKARFPRQAAAMERSKARVSGWWRRISPFRSKATPSKEAGHNRQENVDYPSPDRKELE